MDGRWPHLTLRFLEGAAPWDPLFASVVHGVGEGAFGPTWSTLRQTITPAGSLGRVNSVERFLLWGAVPLGQITAGALSVELSC